MPPSPTVPDLIPTAEVARIYGCDVRTVHRMVRDGRLEPAIKAPGKRGALLFRREDVFAAAVQAHYLESVRTGGDRIKRRRAS